MNTLHNWYSILNLSVIEAFTKQIPRINTDTGQWFETYLPYFHCPFVEGL